MAVIAVKLYKQYGSEDFSPTVLRDSPVTDTSITVEFVVAKPGGQAAVCTVQAFDVNNLELGEAQVPVPAGANVTVTYTLTTSARAYIAEVPNCGPAS
jgi:hypothetical protein